MEIFDVVDERGIPTGETVERNEAHAKGIRHRTAHIWVIRQWKGRWQVLLQKRAQGKDSFPGCYDTSSAGHIQAGDESKESAVRELGEELGIQADDSELQFAGTFDIAYEKEFYGKLFKDNEVSFVYVLRKNVDDSQLKLQEEELERVDWFDLEYVNQKLHPRSPEFCVPSDGFAIIYNWCKEN